MGVGRRSRWAIASLAVLLYWLAAHSLRPLVTIRLDELGATDAQIALTVAAYSVFSLLLAIPGGRLVDRVGVMRVLVVSLTAMVLVGVGYALATTPEQIIALQAVNGVVELGVWLALQSLATPAAVSSSPASWRCSRSHGASASRSARRSAVRCTARWASSRLGGSTPG